MSVKSWREWEWESLVGLTEAARHGVGEGEIGRK